MKKGIKTFPTILGLFFLLIILAVGVFLSTKKTSLRSDASSSCDPINPQVTNLTDSSFDYSFLTTGKNCQSTLSVNGQIISNLSPVDTSHYFQVNNLTPSTTYTWSIVSGGKKYESTFYSLKTGLKPAGPVPASNLAWGRVLNSDRTPLSGAIVYLNIPGSQTLSAITNREGKWNISFANSFNDKINNWFTPPDNFDEEIVVYSPENQVTSVINKTNNNDPVPDIIFGQVNQDLSAQSAGSLPTTTPATSSISLSLTSPKNNETITTQRPDVFGQATAGSNLRLILDDKAFQVHVPENNTWHWSPVNDLSLGSHQLSVSDTQDTIHINFSVSLQSQGNSNIAFTATPSATLIPTQPIITLTSTPTQSLPSPTITPIPTVRTAKISTTSTLYKSGNSLPTTAIIVASVLLFSVSLFYYRP